MTDPRALYAQAAQAFNRHDWSGVLRLAPPLLTVAPGHSGLHYMTGIANLEMRQVPAALAHLAQAAALAPDNVGYLACYARALSAAHQHPKAVEAADRAIALAPGDPGTLDTLGVVYTQAGAYAPARAAFERAIALAPRQAHLRFNLASVLIYLGQIDAAEQELETCLSLDRLFWRAHLTLSQLRRQSPTNNHLARLRSLLPHAQGNPQASMHLHLALSKEHEDLGEFSTAFEHLAQGKQAGRPARRYAIDEEEQRFAALRASSAVVASANDGDPSHEPIFVFGMPRTGTTLVERILGSHPLVHAAGELQNFGFAFKRATASRTRSLLDPETIARAEKVDWRRLGADYIASTRPETAARPHFVDKLPHNFLYAGFIARALPNARLVCLRRDPMDTCLSNFRQLFAAHSSAYFDYAWDLLDTGRYYLLFDQLMAHWRQALPGRILELQYERLVDDPASETRRLLDHCGLAWHEGCLRFEDNQASVSTPSAVQVRSPMSRDAVGRWRRYGEALAPLQQLLSDAGVLAG